MEEIKIRPNGIRLTRGPGTYKIPTADDIPRQFHVALLKDSSNESAIFSSKVNNRPKKKKKLQCLLGFKAV